MKRFAILVCAIAAVILSGCKKDEKQEEFSLTGTTWVGQRNEDTYHVFRFISESEVEYTRRYDSPTGSIGAEYPGIYTLNYPKLSIISYTTPGSTSDILEWDCTFVDKQTFRAEDSMDILVEFIKQ